MTRLNKLYTRRTQDPLLFWPCFYYIFGGTSNNVAKWPGSTHDSFIFTNSVVGQQRQTQPRILEDGLLLRDSGYLCRPYLMTPYLNPCSAQQEAFNRAHTKTCVAIEQAFG